MINAVGGIGCGPARRLPRVRPRGRGALLLGGGARDGHHAARGVAPGRGAGGASRRPADPAHHAQPGADGGWPGPAGACAPRAGQRGGGGGGGGPAAHALPGVAWSGWATSASFGRLYVAPRIPRLLERYPELTLDLRMSDGVSDLVAEGVDLVGPRDQRARIRAWWRARSARPAGWPSRRPACIAAHGEPTPSLRAEPPAVHHLLRMRRAPGEWHFEGPDGPVAVAVGGRFRTDNGEGVREAVLAGLGFAVLPTWFFGTEVTDGRLRPVLTGVGAAGDAHHGGVPVAPQPGAAGPGGDRLPGGRIPARPGDLGLRRTVTPPELFGVPPHLAEKLHDAPRHRRIRVAG